MHFQGVMIHFFSEMIPWEVKVLIVDSVAVSEVGSVVSSVIDSVLDSEGNSIVH